MIGPRHFAKSKTICITFLYTKIQTLYVARFFMKILKLALIYKQHDTLRYVTYTYTKSRDFSKSKTIWVTVLYTKILTLCVTRFLMEFLKLAEGGGGLYPKKNVLCFTFLYAKNNTLCDTFLYKIQTLCVTFSYAKNNALCVTFLYLKCIV